MKSSLVILIMLFLSTTNQSKASVITDWLQYTPGADRFHFSYVNDLGVTVAQAELTITNGSFPPFSPSGGTLQSEFWMAPLSYTDSVFGNSSVATTKIQVAPVAGLAKFKLALSGCLLYTSPSPRD